MSEKNPDTKSSNKIQIVSKALTTALKLWLRSQVSQVSKLEVEITASSRQLLSGSIPYISIFANHAVYQGIHITQIQLSAENIRVNIGSVLKGQPLRLSQIVPVKGELILNEEEVNASLSSGLLSTALNDLLVNLLPEYRQKSKYINCQKIVLENSRLVLNATLAEDSRPITISMIPELLSTHELQLSRIEIQKNLGSPWEAIKEHYADLGSDVDIQELTLMPGKVVCRGRINVNP